ncbi:MAG TPA: FecR domain-containing protein [Burkholderiales bacterium]
MKRILGMLFAALLAGADLQAAAAPAGVVEGVQMPAWAERAVAGGIRRIPLAPGMELRGGDEVKTGAGSRVYLKLAEGSLIKLGENASLRILELSPDRGGLFRAALNVLEGAFRFTTDALARERRRDVTIRVATVTAGIRGTDLWGKSDRADKQVVCLIEGRIEVGAEGETPVVMDQERQFYQRDKGKTAPVGFVEPAQLVQWAQQTEIADGQGAARLGGKWRVTLATAPTQGEALEVYTQLRTAGYAAEIHPAKAGEKRIYHVRISRLPTRGDAEALAAQLRGMHGVTEPGVSN